MCYCSIMSLDELATNVRPTHLIWHQQINSVALTAFAWALRTDARLPTGTETR